MINHYLQQQQQTDYVFAQIFVPALMNINISENSICVLFDVVKLLHK